MRLTAQQRLERMETKVRSLTQKLRFVNNTYKRKIIISDINKITITKENLKKSIQLKKYMRNEINKERNKMYRIKKKQEEKRLQIIPKDSDPYPYMRRRFKSYGYSILRTNDKFEVFKSEVALWPLATFRSKEAARKYIATLPRRKHIPILLRNKQK